MKINNRDVMAFAEFLELQQLAGRKSRLRSKFVKKLTDHLDEVEKERVTILEELATRNEDGSIKVVNREDGTKTFDLTDDALAQFKVEYGEVLDDFFVIEENEENRNLLTAVRDIVLDSTLPVAGGQAVLYDRFCEIVEAIQY